MKTFHIVVDNSENEPVVLSIDAKDPLDAVEKLNNVTDEEGQFEWGGEAYRHISEGPRCASVDDFTDNYSRAKGWRQDCASERHNDNMAAAEFEEKAYGRRDDEY